MKTIPDNAICYKSTAVFTQDTIPAALLRSHTTAEHVWGRITVLEGSLLYRITDPAVEPEEWLLDVHCRGVVEPKIQHEVALLGPVRFQVDFHRIPAAPTGS
ncbi:MAG: DUF1971 domain-containing protein [Pseudomonadota bacterium]